MRQEAFSIRFTLTGRILANHCINSRTALGGPCVVRVVSAVYEPPGVIHPFSAVTRLEQTRFVDRSLGFDVSFELPGAACPWEELLLQTRPGTSSCDYYWRARRLLLSMAKGLVISGALLLLPSWGRLGHSIRINGGCTAPNRPVSQSIFLDHDDGK